jgi:hypothetical protein
MGSHLHSFPFPYKKKKKKKTPRFIPMNKGHKISTQKEANMCSKHNKPIFFCYFFVIPEIEQSPPSLKGVVVYKRGEVDIASPLLARGVCVL